MEIIAKPDHSCNPVEHNFVGSISEGLIIQMCTKCGEIRKSPVGGETIAKG